MTNSIKHFLDRRGKRFWWIVRFVLVALIALAIFVLGWKGGEDYVTNIYTELIGVVISIGFTVVFVDRFYERRNREHQIDELKKRLVQEAGSRANNIATSAVEWLREKNWLIGNEGLLKGAILNDANLQGANLVEANLQGAYLRRANLQKAELVFAQMQKARLQFANLQNVTLVFANLQRAVLFGANMRYVMLSDTNFQGAEMQKVDLKNAILHGVDLQGADLSNANLQEATLYNLKLSGAILPDGQLYTDSIDLEKYTNPHHPDYHDYSKTLRIEESLRNLYRI